MKSTHITIASGKGGTGKTTIACCLALSAIKPVHYLDCDVEEPNAHIFLKPTLTESKTVSFEVPKIDSSKCSFCGKCAEICMYNALAVVPDDVITFSELCHSCGGCWTLCPEQAIQTVPMDLGIIENGMADNVKFTQGKLKIGTVSTPAVIKEVKKEAHSGHLVLMDAPPGTSCPVVATIKDSDFVLLVTEPTPMGLNDLIIALEVVQQMDIPCGVIINRCTDIYNKVENYCQEHDIPVLMRIPVDMEIARAYAQGIPAIHVKPDLKKDFNAILDHIERVTAG